MYTKECKQEEPDGLDVKPDTFKNWEQLKNKKIQKLSNNNTAMKSETHNTVIELTTSMAINGKKQKCAM